MKSLVVACCVLMLAPAVASAEVYKWKDASGKTHYSDSPPLSNIPYSTLSGKKPANASPQRAGTGNAGAEKPKTDAAGKPMPPGTNGAAKPGEAKPAEGKAAPDAKNADPAAQKNAQEEKAAKEAEAKKQQEEKLAAEKKAKEQACKAARTRVAQFEQGGRMYRVNERGEREYYGDKEVAVELEQAKSDVEANCE